MRTTPGNPHELEPRFDWSKAVMSPGAPVGVPEDYERRRRAFHEAFDPCVPAIRQFAQDIGRGEDWAAVAGRTRDPRRRALALALSFLCKPQGPDDQKRFSYYNTARRSLVLLGRAQAFLVSQDGLPFTQWAAEELAPVVAMAAQHHASALERGGADRRWIDEALRLTDAKAVKRVLRGRGRRAVREALVAFVPVAVLNFAALMDQTELPAMTPLRKEDPEIDEALRVLDAEGVLIDAYNRPFPRT